MLINFPGDLDFNTWRTLTEWRCKWTRGHLPIPLTFCIIGEMKWWNSLNSRSWEHIGKRKWTWTVESGKKVSRATSNRIAEVYVQDKPKHITIYVSVRNCFNSFFTSWLTWLYTWNANTSFTSETKSRSKWLTSKLSHGRCCTYLKGKEWKFKIYVDIDPTDHFPLFFFTVKGNLSIFITLYLPCFRLFGLFLIFLFWWGSRKITWRYK